MLLPSLLLNDRNLEDFGLRLVSSRWIGISPRQYEMVPLEGRQGGVFVDRGSRTDPSDIPLQTILKATTVAERRSLFDAIAAALEGELEIQVVDDSSRVTYGVLQELEANAFDPVLVEPYSRPDFVLKRANGLWYDRLWQELVIPNAAQPKAVPCGSAPHGGKLWVMDAAGSRTISVLNQRGDVIQTLSSTGSFSGNEYLEIDNDAERVWLVTGLTRTDVTGTAWMGSADSFLLFDPKDKPRLKHSGSGDLVLYYRRSYRS